MNGCIHFTMNNCTNFSVIHGVTILPYRKDSFDDTSKCTEYIFKEFFSFLFRLQIHMVVEE